MEADRHQLVAIGHCKSYNLHGNGAVRKGFISKFGVFLDGPYARSEQLIQATQDFDRRRKSAEELESTFTSDIKRIITRLINRIALLGGNMASSSGSQRTLIVVAVVLSIIA